MTDKPKVQNQLTDLEFAEQRITELEAKQTVLENALDVVELRGFNQTKRAEVAEVKLKTAIETAVEYQEEAEAAEGQLHCPSCAGAGKPVSGKPCVCGGSGHITDAYAHLLVLYNEQSALYEEKEAQLAGLVEALQRIDTPPKQGVSPEFDLTAKPVREHYYKIARDALSNLPAAATELVEDEQLLEMDREQFRTLRRDLYYFKKERDTLTEQVKGLREALKWIDEFGCATGFEAEQLKNCKAKARAALSAVPKPEHPGKEVLSQEYVDDLLANPPEQEAKKEPTP